MNQKQNQKQKGRARGGGEKVDFSKFRNLFPEEAAAENSCSPPEGVESPPEQRSVAVRPKPQSASPPSENGVKPARSGDPLEPKRLGTVLPTVLNGASDPQEEKRRIIGQRLLPGFAYSNETRRKVVVLYEAAPDAAVSLLQDIGTAIELYGIDDAWYHRILFNVKNNATRKGACLNAGYSRWLEEQGYSRREIYEKRVELLGIAKRSR